MTLPPYPTRANVYSGNRLDRVDHRRHDAEWVRARLREASSRITLMAADRHAVDAENRPLWLGPAEVEAFLEEGGELVFLGLDAGVAHFALELTIDFLEARSLSLRDLRETAPLLPASECSHLAYARALFFWHRRHRHCGSCGSPSLAENAGHLRRCSNPACGALHFPRTDPAVIMLIHDGGERCILGRQASWPPGRHSVLAGFVEPGESLEEAVAREVREEVGVAVPPENVRYHSSQPWPFPSSIMLGFWAEAPYAELEVNLEELETASWVTRQALRDSAEDDRFGLPSHDSIARRLLEDWLALG